jgi:hypothetical protein
MGNPTSLPDFVLDVELIADITQAVACARGRQTHAIKIFGSLVGATIIQAKLAGASLHDVVESVKMCWNGENQ